MALSPGEGGSFNSSYYPSAVVGSGGLPSDQEYSDTVTANGEEQIAGTPVPGTATATCKLCEPDEVCPTTP